ncbi:MAG: tRNA (guanosine(37)-N1)-methyltransferase TrmD [Calditrichota bacterium]
MRVDIISLFPHFFDSIFDESILRRARDGGKLEVKLHNLRSYCTDKHHQADDYRFGGGAGMLLKPDPFHRAMETVLSGVRPTPLVIFPTPQGIPFNQDIADELVREPHLVFLCGHYKGIDQRVVDRWVNREYSLGDYVLTGGEIATAVIIDAVTRMIPGVLGDLDSARSDSFREGIVDGPHYTRPESCAGVGIPGILKGGHHKNIERWRRLTAELLTAARRPEFLRK